MTAARSSPEAGSEAEGWAGDLGREFSELALMLACQDPLAPIGFCVHDGALDAIEYVCKIGAPVDPTGFRSGSMCIPRG